MVDWNNAPGAIRGFLDSRFGRSLISIDWPGVLDKLEIRDQVIKRLQEQATGLMDILVHPLFTKLFSRRVIVALLPVDSVSFAHNPRQVLQENMLMVLNPQHGGALPEFVAQLVSGQSKGESLSYQGVSINVLVRQDRKIYLAVISGKLVVSPGLKPVQESIDLSLNHLVKERTGFLLNSEYAALKKRGRGKDDFFVYADLARLKPLLKALPFPGHIQKGQNFIEFPGSKRMVIFHHSYKNIEQFTSIVQFDPDQLDTIRNIRLHFRRIRSIGTILATPADPAGRLDAAPGIIPHQKTNIIFRGCNDFCFDIRFRWVDTGNRGAHLPFLERDLR